MLGLVRFRSLVPTEGQYAGFHQGSALESHDHGKALQWRMMAKYNQQNMYTSINETFPK